MFFCSAFMAMNLTELQKETLKGWNTWYNEDMLTHVLLPWGFAINLNFRKKSSGDVFRMKWIDRDPSVKVDIRSFDGSYTCLHLRHGTTPIKVESAVKNGEQVLLITPEGYYTEDEQLIVNTAFLWGYDGTLLKENGRLGAICPDGTKIRLYSNTAPCDYYLPEWQAPSMFFAMNSPVVISTVPYSTEEAHRLMGESRAAVLLESQKYGVYAEAFQGLQCCLGWNAIYDPCKKRICSPVCRAWNRGQGGRLFCWDTFFVALMYLIGDLDKAYLNIKGILDAMTEDGMVPNCTTNDTWSMDRSQPQVGSMVVEEIFRKNHDVDFVKEVYPKLMRWNTWYYENRMRENGFMSWGSKIKATGAGNLFGAKCESGMDNSPMFDDAVYDPETGLCMQADVGVSGLFIGDCKALIHLAEISGNTDDISVLQLRKTRAEKGLSRLWNEDDGIFENLDLVTGKWVRHLTPMNFFALYSDIVTKEQKKRMMEEYLLNPAEFWGEYVIPSVSRQDYAFHEQHYWRGRIWAPLNYLVYEALKDAGLLKEAKMLGEKSAQLFLLEWNAHRHVHENYSAVDGMGCSARQSDAFYHWGALLAYIGIDSMEIQD